jgi:multidrug efflux pump subunit AcrA (membrane-fusion protein)
MKQQSDIQQNIHAVLAEIADLKKVQDHVAALEVDLQEAHKKLRKAKINLDKELRDVEELEKIGIKSLFYKTLGGKEEQLEKERQEYLNAALHYKELNKSIELIEFELNILTKKSRRVDELNTRLDALKRQREDEILNSHYSAVRNDLLELTHKLEQNALTSKSVSTAIEEGEKSLKLIKVVFSFLRKAKDWGRWDMVNNSRRAGYMKHQSIDMAVRNLTRAQQQLNRFSRELATLGNNHISFNLRMEQSKGFMDIFFDNLISDWIVQQRIKTTLSNVEKTYGQVQQIVIELREQLTLIHNEAENFIDQKNALIIS